MHGRRSTIFDYRGARHHSASFCHTVFRVEITWRLQALDATAFKSPCQKHQNQTEKSVRHSILIYLLKRCLSAPRINNLPAYSGYTN